jgi:hypothetical protein
LDNSEFRFHQVLLNVSLADVNSCCKSNNEFIERDTETLVSIFSRCHRVQIDTEKRVHGKDGECLDGEESD